MPFTDNVDDQGFAKDACKICEYTYQYNYQYPKPGCQCTTRPDTSSFICGTCVEKCGDKCPFCNLTFEETRRAEVENDLNIANKEFNDMVPIGLPFNVGRDAWQLPASAEERASREREGQGGDEREREEREREQREREQEEREQDGQHEGVPV